MVRCAAKGRKKKKKRKSNETAYLVDINVACVPESKKQKKQCKTKKMELKPF